MRSDGWRMNTMSERAQKRFDRHTWTPAAQGLPEAGRTFELLFTDGSGSQFSNPDDFYWEDPAMIGWRYITDAEEVWSDRTHPDSGADLRVCGEAIPDRDPFDRCLDHYFSLADTLSERGSRYGDFADNANISQQLQRIMQDAPSYSRMTDLQREGLTAVMQKIARILNGDPNYADNWHDIQGYARLVEERLPK